MVSFTQTHYPCRAGPDCTLMSKVFKVTSSSHSNSVEEAEFEQTVTNIDRGCFGVEITKPALGDHVQAGKSFPINIRKWYSISCTNIC